MRNSLGAHVGPSLVQNGQFINPAGSHFSPQGSTGGANSKNGQGTIPAPANGLPNHHI